MKGKGMFYDEFYDCLLNGDGNGLSQAIASGQPTNIIMEHPSVSPQVDYECACGKTTPVLVAAFCGYVECLRVLTQNGASVNLLPCQNHNSALHIACRSPSNSVMCVELLLSNGAIVNLPDSEGYVPLHIAVQYSKPDVVKLLLQSGADVNRTAHENESPLLLATSYPLDFPMVQLLLKNGADACLPDKFRNTALQLATKQVHVQAVKLLLRHSANPNTLDIYHQSPLFSVAKVMRPMDNSTSNPPLCLQALLNHGANIKQICLRQNIFQVVMAICPDNVNNFTVLISAYDYIDAVLRPLLPIIHIIPAEVQLRNSSFYANLTYLARNPRTLQHLCRCIVRKCLQKNCGKLANSLPLPDRLKEYILLKPSLCGQFYL
ncbi:ankyrin repeat and SOCS box protein 4-like [Ptychodera flava]|uniref:ankyrin repeat and SOCS box protein 4-like n=1 Tax=Ptychodera flava TaxID=63121 RepID=UPI00396A075C